MRSTTLLQPLPWLCGLKWFYFFSTKSGISDAFRGLDGINKCFDQKPLIATNKASRSVQVSPTSCSSVVSSPSGWFKCSKFPPFNLHGHKFSRFALQKRCFSWNSARWWLKYPTKNDRRPIKKNLDVMKRPNLPESANRPPSLKTWQLFWLNWFLVFCLSF